MIGSVARLAPESRHARAASPSVPPGRRRACGPRGADAPRSPGRRRQGAEVPPRYRHLQHRQGLGRTHTPQGVPGRRPLAGRAAHHAQARRRAEPEQGRTPGGPQALRRCRRRHLGLRQRLRVSFPRPGRGQEEHRDLQGVRPAGRGHRRQGRQGAAQRPAEGRAHRKDPRTDRQGPDRVRQGGRGCGRRNLGRGPRRRTRRPARHAIRPTARPSWSTAA